jgi:hypothetical protein
MKRITTAALWAALVGVASAAPAAAQQTGSRNLIAPPPSFASDAGRAAMQAVVVRHPTQAGKVSQTISGNFVPSAGHGWIAKGDKRYSLCATTKDQRVACAPLIATAVMADLEIGSLPAKGGITMVTFKIAPDTKRPSLALARSAGAFMQRIGRLSAQLERQTVSFAPKPTQQAMAAGDGASAVQGETCGGYDEFGSNTCTGGGVGGSGGGGGGDGGGGGGDWGDCDGYCDFPSGNDTGDPVPFDPTTGEGIDPDMPQVVIVGQRPEHGTVEPPPVWINAPLPNPVIIPIPTEIEQVEMMPVGCVPGPRGSWVCPPPTPANPFALPKPERGLVWKWRWSDIEWCRIWNNCGPKTSDSEPKPPAVTPAEKFLRAMENCRATARATIEFCVRMEPVRDEATNLQCGTDALEDYKACEATAIDIYNNGAGR